MPLSHGYCHQLEPGNPRDPSCSLSWIVPVPRLLFAIPSAPAQVSLAESQSKLVGHTWHKAFPKFLVSELQYVSFICSMEAAVWKCFKALRVWCVTLLAQTGSHHMLSAEANLLARTWCTDGHCELEERSFVFIALFLLQKILL